MKKFFQSQVVAIAFALFAMLFGSGNIALPLGLGRDTGVMAFYAMLGFFATAVFLPLIGIIATVLYDGDYKKFLGRIGTIPGALMTLLCLLLMGPFFIIPRCIALAYSALAWFIPFLTYKGAQLAFIGMVCVMLFELTRKPSRVVDILGKILGPVKLILLCAVIIKGLFTHPEASACALSGWESFSRGFFDGYGTLDLIAGIFFSGLILANIKSSFKSEGSVSHQQVLAVALKGGTLAALILGCVYAGFVMISAFNAEQVMCISRDQLLSALSAIILGGGGGVLASITVAVACLTTALAVTTVFAQYLNKDLSRGRISYNKALLITLAISSVLAKMGFDGLVTLVLPVIKICYPALIVLALCNIAYKLFGFKPVKAPFFVTLMITILLQWL